MLLGVAFASCATYGKRNTEAEVETVAELNYKSRGYGVFGGFPRSRRSPINQGVGWDKAVCDPWKEIPGRWKHLVM